MRHEDASVLDSRSDACGAHSLKLRVGASPLQDLMISGLKAARQQLEQVRLSVGLQGGRQFVPHDFNHQPAGGAAGRPSAHSVGHDEHTVQTATKVVARQDQVRILVSRSPTLVASRTRSELTTLSHTVLCSPQSMRQFAVL